MNDSSWFDATNGGDTDAEAKLNDRQREILSAAIKVFSRKGYDSSRTKEIATEAKITEATLFKHFPTKLSLLQALVIPLVERVVKPMALRSMRRLIAQKADTPIEDMIAGIIKDRIELFRANKDLLRTVLFDLSRQADIGFVIERMIPDVVGLMQAAFRPAMERGEIIDEDPVILGRTLMAQLIGFIALSEVAPAHFKIGSDEEEIDRMVRFCLDGIRKRKETSHD